MANKTNTKLRQQIIDTCKLMNSMGINQGTSGNISARVDGGMLITPSAIPYEQITPKDIIFVDEAGEREDRNDGKVPSTEWRFHIDILSARKDVNAVVHNHSMYATIVSIRHQSIPSVHYMIAAAGGTPVRCSKYATFGTKELSTYALQALKGMNACLLANHGLIAVGPNIDKALWLAKEVEVLAQQYVFATLLGGAKLLPKKEIDFVLSKFKDYGLKS